MITKEDFLIDWRNDSIEINRIVRGLYPNAYTIYRGKRLKIINAEPFNLSPEGIDNLPNEFIYDDIRNESIKTGQIISISSNKGLMVKTNNGALLITRAQIEGKSPVNSDKLAQQMNDSINEILG